MSYLFLVRHGQARLDGDDYDQLSELGRIQAEMLGLAWTARNLKVDHAYSGTLNRHLQTATIVADTYRRAGSHFPEIKVDAGFDEIDSLGIVTKIMIRLSEADPEFRNLAKQTKLAIEQNAPDKLRLFNRTYRKIIDTWINNRDPSFDGVSWDDYCRRVLDTRAELQKYETNDHIVVFTSGNPMGIYIKEALGLPNEKALEIVDHLYNVNVTTFILNEDRMTLLSMNEISHLKDDQKTHV